MIEDEKSQEVRKVRIWKHIAADGSSCLCIEKMFGKFCPICDYARKRLKRISVENNNEYS